MELKKNVLMENEVTDKILCNKCGNEIHKDSFGEFRDHLHVDKTWGYLSSCDGKKYVFDICEECFKEFVGSFRITAE